MVRSPSECRRSPLVSQEDRAARTVPSRSPPSQGRGPGPSGARWGGRAASLGLARNAAHCRAGFTARGSHGRSRGHGRPLGHAVFGARRHGTGAARRSFSQSPAAARWCRGPEGAGLGLGPQDSAGPSGALGPRRGAAPRHGATPEVSARLRCTGPGKGEPNREAAVGPAAMATARLRCHSDAQAPPSAPRHSWRRSVSAALWYAGPHSRPALPIPFRSQSRSRSRSRFRGLSRHSGSASRLVLAEGDDPTSGCGRGPLPP